MTIKEIEFSFKARYYKLGEVNEMTKQIWFVLHGYGQLAQFFVQKFKSLKDHGICVIAPEGLSRFYLEDLQHAGRKNNRVGATWMTRENREMDIANYIAYLDVIYRTEIKTNAPVTILGFSQGAATACRWVMNQQVRFDRLILWAGIFPPDMNFDEGTAVLGHKEILFVHGKKDPFLTPDRLKEMQSLAAKLQAQVETVEFEGEHDVDEGTLLTLMGG